MKILLKEGDYWDYLNSIDDEKPPSKNDTEIMHESCTNNAEIKCVCSVKKYRNGWIWVKN